MKKLALYIIVFVFNLSFASAQVKDSLDLLMHVSHKFGIERIAIAADGKLFATGSNDGYIKVWDTRTATIIYSLGEMGMDGRGVTALCFTPDGKYLLSGTIVVRVWDLTTGRMVRILNTSDMVYCHSIDISPDSKTALIGMGDTYLCDIGSGKVIRRYKNAGFTWCVKFSKDARQFLSGWDDGSLRLYDSSSDSLIRKIKLNEKGIKAACFSNGETNVLFSAGDSIYIGNKNTGSLIKSFKGQANRDRSIYFAPDNRSILVADLNTVRKIDLRTGNSDTLLSNGYLNDVAYSNDGKRVIYPIKPAGSMYGLTEVMISNLESGKSIKGVVNKFSSFGQVKFYSDNHTLATVVDRSQIRIIDLSNITTFRTINDDNIGKFDFSNDGKQLVYAHGEKSNLFLTVVNFDSLKITNTLSIPASVTSISFSNDNKLMGIGMITGEVQIIDRSSWEVVLVFKVTYGNNKLYFSTDNKLLLIANEESLEMLDIVRLKREWYYPHDVPFNEQKFPKVNFKNWKPEAITLMQLFKNNPAFRHFEIVPTDGRSVLDYIDRATFTKRDIKSGTLVEYQGHQGKVITLSVSDDNKFIASTGSDYTMRIWDNVTGKTLVSYIAFDRNEWFWLTPENYYYSSKNASKAVNFRKNGMIYRFHQFDLQLHRPDLVMKNIGVSSDSLVLFYRQLVDKRYRTMGLKADAALIGLAAPTIDIVNVDSIPDIATKAFVSLRVKAASALQDLKKINIWVNGVPVYHTAVEKNRTVLGKTYQALHKVPLTEGKNLIEISASNQLEQESLIQSITINYKSPVKQKPDLYIVSIGVSDYAKYPASKLKYADKDAKNLVEKFSSSTIFEKVHSETLMNIDANRSNILKIKNMFMNSRPNDLVILSFSGHGIINNNRDFYFCTNEIDLDRIDSTAVSFKEMENLLDGIPSYKKMLLIDACYSGEIDKETAKVIVEKNDSVKAIHINDAKPIVPYNTLKLGRKTTFELIKESFLDLRRRTGTAVISSSSGVDVSYEKNEWQNGLFTYGVLNALANSKDVDLNDDGIYVSELIPYLLKLVKNLSGGLQVPTVREENIDFDFRIW